MYKYGFPFSAAAIALAFGNSARAIGLDDLGECYTRHYTAAHLRNQPNQNVSGLELEIDPEGQSIVLSGTNRSGQFGYDKFSCYENPGSEYFAPACMTYEADSQLWIKKRSDGSIVIETRNTVLSDIGGTNYKYADKDEQNGHHVFYLEEARHSPSIGSGPFFSYRLYPAKAGACPKIEE